MFDQTGDRYQAAMSRWALARTQQAQGRASDADELLATAEAVLEQLGASHDLDSLRAERTDPQRAVAYAAPRVRQ